MSHKGLLIRRVMAGPITTNAYLIGDAAEGRAVLVDPARGAAAPLLEVAASQGFEVEWIINTHGHWDHIADNAEAHTLSGAPIAVHAADAERLRQPRSAAVLPFEVRASEPEWLLEEGDVVEVGAFRFGVLHTPGHSPGSVCLYEEAAAVLIAGDTLFAGCCGRTDFPGGDGLALADSLERLLGLPDEVQVFSGHGDETTIGAERPCIPQLVVSLRAHTRRAVPV